QQAGSLDIAPSDPQLLADASESRGWREALIEAHGVETDAGLVLQDGREAVRPTEDRVSHRFVDSFTSPGVRDWKARQRILLQIHLRPAAEDVILVGEGIVDLNIALIVVEIVPTRKEIVVAVQSIELRERIEF